MAELFLRDLLALVAVDLVLLGLLLQELLEVPVVLVLTHQLQEQQQVMLVVEEVALLILTQVVLLLKEVVLVLLLQIVIVLVLVGLVRQIQVAVLVVETKLEAVTRVLLAEKV